MSNLLNIMTIFLLVPTDQSLLCNLTTPPPDSFSIKGPYPHFISVDFFCVLPSRPSCSSVLSHFAHNYYLTIAIAVYLGLDISRLIISTTLPARLYIPALVPV